MADQATITFDKSQWDRVLKQVQKKWKDIEKRKEFGGIIQAKVFEDVMSHFDKEAGPSGKWKAWSEVYTEHMKQIGRATNKILQFDGRLRQSFIPTSWRPQSEGILFYNPAKTKKGFPYAAAHDEGGPKLPQRKFMWISDTAMAKIVDITQNWLNPDNGKAE